MAAWRISDWSRYLLRRPLSKNKTWRMIDILRRERVYDAEAAAKSSDGGLAEESAASSHTHLGSMNRGFAASADL